MAIDRDRWARWTEEDAFAFCVDTLAALLKGEFRHEARNFDITAIVLRDQLFQVNRITEHNDKINMESLIGAKILSALWQLCLKGVLRASPRSLQDTMKETSDGYSLTEQGREWIKNQDKHPMLVASKSFADLLSKYSSRFGAAYQERVADTIRCFDAGAYLGCCAMCGAACEAIYLALATEKEGQDQAEAVLKKYRAADGRKQLQNILNHGLNGGLTRGIEGGFTVLAYWRDISAHGETVGVGHAEARTALNTLLSLAQLADDRWDELTTKTRPAAANA